MQPVVTQHFFLYNAKGPVTATMLAESLVGLDGIVAQSGRVLGSLLKTRVRDTSVIIQSVEIGSYRDNFAVRMIFGKGKQLERNLEKLRKDLKLDNMTVQKVAGIAIALVLAYGIWEFAIAGKDEKTVITIENSFNNWGGDLGLSKDEVIGLLRDAVQSREVVKKHVVQLTKPDGSDTSGAIELRTEDKTFAIPADAVKVVPSKYGKEKPHTPVMDFDDVQIVIRAADLDKMKTGWAAIAAEISDRRLPVVLDEGVDPTRAPIGKFTRADITVIYRTNKAGHEIPNKILIRKLHEQLQAKQ